MAVNTRPEITIVSLDNLIIDPRYQRGLDEKRVKRIVAHFRWDQFGVLEVSERDNDQYAVFDGQHRLSAASQLAIDAVPCIVHQSLSAEEEAVLFTLLQTERKGLSQLDRFRAQVFAKDRDALRLQAVIDSCGMRFGKQREQSDGLTISAVANVERVYRRYGEDHLSLTLTEIKRIWESDPGALHGKFIVGMATFLANYGDGRYDDEMKGRLAAISPLALLRRANVVHAGDERPGIAVYEQIRKVARPRGRVRKFER